jgi:gluconokinase
MVIVLMGVAGSGKTTVGRALAGRLGCPFYDGDDFHPPQNVAKMAAGEPLSDEERRPWLARLRAIIDDHLGRGDTAVVACSALRESYRAQLGLGRPGLYFVYLKGEPALIRRRLEGRPDHFMRADMLPSQFAALEPPGAGEALAVDIDQDNELILRRILEWLG